MPKRDWRLGVYECKVENGIVSRSAVSQIWYTYVSFPPSDVEDYKKLIYDELTIFNRSKRPFHYPILVESWRLAPAEQIENKVRREDRHNLFASRVGGLRKLKKLIGQSTKRIEVPGTRRKEVVIFRDGLIIKVKNNHLMNT
jgi:hypothetical protein